MSGYIKNSRKKLSELRELLPVKRFIKKEIIEPIISDIKIATETEDQQLIINEEIHETGNIEIKECSEKPKVTMRDVYKKRRMQRSSGNKISPKSGIIGY